MCIYIQNVATIATHAIASASITYHPKASLDGGSGVGGVIHFIGEVSGYF